MTKIQDLLRIFTQERRGNGKPKGWGRRAKCCVMVVSVSSKLRWGE